MKTLFVAVAIALAASNAVAAIKCENTPKGMCCWDTVRDGPFKPISCY